MSDPVRVLVADDHAVVRTALSRSLELHPEFHVVGEAADGHEAIEQVRQLHPDVVIMDASMPGLSGIEATRLLTRSFPDLRIVGLSMHDSDWMARSMLDAGAAAFVEKSGPFERLVEAIRGEGEQPPDHPADPTISATSRVDSGGSSAAAKPGRRRGATQKPQ